jgi:hypothetical protein
LIVEFTRIRHLLDTEVVVETSASGRIWQEAVLTADGPPVDRGDGTERVRLRQTAPLPPDESGQLLRLRFTIRP